MLNKFIIM